MAVYIASWSLLHAVVCYKLEFIFVQWWIASWDSYMQWWITSWDRDPVLEDQSTITISQKAAPVSKTSTHL